MSDNSTDTISPQELNILRGLHFGNHDSSARSLALFGDFLETDVFYDYLQGDYPKGISQNSFSKRIKYRLNKLIDKRMIKQIHSTRIRWDGFAYCAPPTHQNEYYISWRGKKAIGAKYT